MKLSQRESVKLKQNLPADATKRIHQALKGKISTRMIQMIIAGSWGDRHGVLKLAADIAMKEKAKRASVKKALKNL